MTIVSHYTQADTHTQKLRRYVRHFFVDHLGATHTHGFSLLAATLTDVDYDAIRAALVAGVETGLAEAEYHNLISMIESGEDVLPAILSPAHATSADLAKRVIRYMMRERDPRIVIALEPLITYLRANYTGAQLRNFLDLTVAQAQKMDARINAILDNKAAVFDAFDANGEEIE